MKKPPLRTRSAPLASPPEHLTTRAIEWWNAIIREYGVADEAGLLLLGSAMQAFDRANAAREILRTEGLTVKDKYGQHRPHPAAGIERDSMKNLLAFLRAMNLDVEPIRPTGRH